jgi:hypothetical protein
VSVPTPSSPSASYVSVSASALHAPAGLHRPTQACLRQHRFSSSSLLLPAPYPRYVKVKVRRRRIRPPSSEPGVLDHDRLFLLFLRVSSISTRSYYASPPGQPVFGTPTAPPSQMYGCGAALTPPPASWLEGDASGAASSVEKAASSSLCPSLSLLAHLTQVLPHSIDLIHSHHVFHLLPPCRPSSPFPFPVRDSCRLSSLVLSLPPFLTRSYRRTSNLPHASLNERQYRRLPPHSPPPVHPPHSLPPVHRSC